ncbi:hypothetical protein JTE90_010733 [Oedothorax gibbosus]|uniref:Uncharacterized protein n=1 Tax=Oedothorax gibbosus TaxID=931172 RepID=A0AAV6UP57_9ARAC|nr:hypothetical protein JTE90_010733 [Oedothorax gibbosus]
MCLSSKHSYKNKHCLQSNLETTQQQCCVSTELAAPILFLGAPFPRVCFKTVKTVPSSNKGEEFAEVVANPKQLKNYPVARLVTDHAKQ